jgi:ComF family protein
MKRFAREIFSSLIELFFPASCLACGIPPKEAGDIMLCQSCLAAIEWLNGSLCLCCGRQFTKKIDDDHLCGLCLKDAFYFDMARALVLYKPPMTTIISNFKYYGQTAGLKSFQALKQQISPNTAEPEIIIPVPLHKKRLQQRGFNQALLLARAFFPNQHLQINSRILERHRYTEPQTSLSGEMRRRNLKNAFQVIDRQAVEGKRVMLVDDVFTTGTTVNECAKVLKKAGAKEVQVLTLARVD